MNPQNFPYILFYLFTLNCHVENRLKRSKGESKESSKKPQPSFREMMVSWAKEVWEVVN